MATSDETKAALLRFCAAVENGKRPAAADARVVAAFVRISAGKPRTLFSPKRRRPGRPPDSRRSFLDVAPKMDVAQVVALRVGKREPTDRDFIAVGMSLVPRLAKETVRRYWRSYGQQIREDIERRAQIERLAPAMRQIIEAFGDEIGELAFDAMRPMLEKWPAASAEERRKMGQKLRRIIDKQFVK